MLVAQRQVGMIVMLVVHEQAGMVVTLVVHEGGRAQETSHPACPLFVVPLQLLLEGRYWLPSDLFQHAFAKLQNHPVALPSPWLANE